MEYNYVIGFPISSEDKDNFANIKKIDDKYYVIIGKTYNTKLRANVGDIITVGVAEIKADKNKDGKIKLSWDNPIVRDLPKESGFIRKPDSVQEIINLSKYHRSYSPNIIKELVSEGTTNSKIESQIDIKEGEKGIGVIQIHALGLSKEEAENFELDKGSSHIDIRLKPDDKEYWEGGEFMIGNSKFFAEKFKKFKKGSKLLFNFKVPRKDEQNPNQKIAIIKGPDVWLNIGIKKPAIFSPGSIGALSKTYAVMIALEKFKWIALEQNDRNGKPHFKKFKIEPTWVNKEWLNKLGWDLDDAPLSGIVEFMYVPTGNERKWMAYNGGSIMKSKFFAKDKIKHEVTGIVYEPDTFDSEGDWMTKEDIIEAERSFVLESLKVLYRHSKPVNAKVVETYVLPSDLEVIDDNGTRQVIKEGTWIMTVRILDPKVWEEIDNGEIVGFSMSGLAEVNEDELN